MSPATHITAICDGASNCWSIVESLEESCEAITKILDWFHISMKFKNIAILPDYREDYDSAKWSLWHGKVDEALAKLTALREVICSNKAEDKLDKLIAYITNNKQYIVCYEGRKNSGLTFTSHMAESTVESLINQRCKGSQHMRWTREGGILFYKLEHMLPAMIGKSIGNLKY